MAEKSYRDYDGINGEPTEFEWNIFPGFTTLQLCGEVNNLLSDLGQTQKLSQEEFYSCQCSMTSRFFSMTGDKDMNGPVLRESEMLVLGEMPC